MRHLKVVGLKLLLGALVLIAAMPKAGFSAQAVQSDWAQLASTGAVQQFLFQLIHGMDLPTYKAQFIAALPAQERPRYNAMTNEDFNRIDGVIVGGYRVVDLDRDGKSEFVAVIGQGGRQLLNTLVIVHGPASNPKHTELLSDPPNDLAKQIVDLDGNGAFEIVTHEALREDPMGRRALWKSVWEWRGDKAMRAEGSHPKFYSESVLAAAETELAKIRSKRFGITIQPGRAPSLLTDCFEISEGQNLAANQREITEEEKEVLASIFHLLAFRARRLATGSDSEAVQRAAQWAKSSRRELRESAAIAFEDLNGPEMQRWLDILAGDKEPRVSGRAKAALGKKGQGREK